jgi:hypothetical protein
MHLVGSHATPPSGPLEERLERTGRDARGIQAVHALLLDERLRSAADRAQQLDDVLRELVQIERPLVQPVEAAYPA